MKPERKEPEKSVLHSAAVLGNKLKIEEINLKMKSEWYKEMKTGIYTVFQSFLTLKSFESGSLFSDWNDRTGKQRHLSPHFFCIVREMLRIPL